MSATIRLPQISHSHGVTTGQLAARGGQRLPSYLGEAIATLKNGGVVLEAVVLTLVGSYLATHE